MEKKDIDVKLEQTKRLLDAFAYLSTAEVKAFTDAIVGAATMNRLVNATRRDGDDEPSGPSKATA